MTSAGRSRAITIICLVTTDCNLRCSYCYTSASHSKSGTIPINSLETLIQNCSEGFDSVEFCWHGGEPLLAGKAFYEAVIAVEQKIIATRGSPIKFINSIQSNRLLLDDELLVFLCSNGFHIGSSFEAP